MMAKRESGIFMRAEGRDLDFRAVREKLITCVGCDGVKQKGLLLCWTCHKRECMENGGAYGHLTTAKLALADRACS